MITLIRHALPVVSADEDPAAWPLTDEGRRAAAALGGQLSLGGRRVIASTERKAIETAAALGVGVPIERHVGLCEVARPWFADRANLLAATERYLHGDAVDAWEPLGDVVTRFAAAIVDDAVLVSHGVALTAWLASVVDLGDPFAFCRGLTMPDAWDVDVEAGDLRRVVLP